MARPVLCTYSKMLFQEHFDADPSLDLRTGDSVVLRTRRGVEVGKVAADPGTTRMRRDQGVAGKVLRRTQPADKAANTDIRLSVKVAPELREARRLGRELAIPAVFVDVEPMLEANRVVLYYTADGRIDLESNGFIRTLTESTKRDFVIRQIGDRDVARLSGDVGSCGQELCCKTFLVDFVPVRMEMAKNQGLAPDPQKASGLCGRLKCCLRYEDDLYTWLKKTMPRSGQPCTVAGSDGWVVAVNLFMQTCTVEVKGKREEFAVADVVFEPNMSEGEIRRFQKEMRAQWAADAEARKTQRESRAASRGQQRKMSDAAPPEGDPEAVASPEDAAAEDEAAARTESTHQHRRRQGPRNEIGSAPRRRDDGRRRTGDRQASAGEARADAGGTPDAAADGEPSEPGSDAGDAQANEASGPRRRRRRGGRRKPRPEGGEQPPATS